MGSRSGELGLSHLDFILGTLRELSFALCHGIASLCRSDLHVSTAASGRAPLRGQARPSTEVAWYCLVWVLVPIPGWSLSLRCWVRVGVFGPAGFALCLALALCGLSFGLRVLSLCGFPCCLPSLSSLYVKIYLCREIELGKPELGKPSCFFFL
jgi:hypothetical protein